MTVNLDIANRALQFFGSRTNMSTSEFNGQTSNEAIQSNLIMFKLRDELNRMAPWNCTRKYANLTYITSQPGTPENSTAGPALWVPGIPPPQWGYEYQYPVDCIRPRYILPQYTSLGTGGVPIYPAGTVTGFSPVGWTGPALKYEVATDNFFTVSAAAVAAGGTGYVVGNQITLVQPSYTFTQSFGGATNTFTMPVGAPAVLQVASVGGGGAVATVTVVNQVFDEPAGTSMGGSYFSAQNPTGVAQGSTTGNGTGATFNLTFGGPGPQRIITCNQESAILCYNTRIIDPNVMDEMFQDAWIAVLAGRLVFQLSGDKALANQAITVGNKIIAEARIADGNENITINDVTPDWFRARGSFGGPSWDTALSSSFDWGSFYSPF